MSSQYSRRIYMDRWTPAEKAIYDALKAVENLPADVRLTAAVMLLNEAQNKVADYVDNVPIKSESHETGKM